MEKKKSTKTILTGTIIAGALLTFSVSADARPSSQVLGNGSEVRSEIIDLNITSSIDNLLEMECGAKEGEAKKTTAKKKDTKATEAKCGEGKCGGDDKKASVKSTKADKAAPKAKAEKKDKTTEAKCGEGKCGAE